ncbi:hypothetical protein ACB094_01G169200 [Castanea mollissima]
MYRAAASRLRLRSLKGQTCNGALARFASSSAVATNPSSASGALFGWLMGGGSKSLPPLDFPLAGVTLPPPLPDYVEPSKTKITTLPNGVKIASETSANPTASIGLYVDCGSNYETPASIGATDLLRRMAFKSTRNRSHLRVVREVEAIGGNVEASSSKEQMSYSFNALKTYVPEMVELLIDSVRNPVFLDWEVNEELQKLKAETSETSKNPKKLLLDAIYSAGYSGALANPILASESAFYRLNSTILEEFVSDNYTAPRLVLAATGVENDELLSVAEPLLSDLPSVSHTEEPKSVYTGGDYRCQSKSGRTHFALTFELPGGWHKEKEAVILTVLEALMGGGGSFSAGGPGKGMYSRLFDQVQLGRAKQSTKSHILINLESRICASEDIGRQILTSGERKPVDHFMKAVDEITVNDITSVAQKLLSSPLTMASYGDVIYVPTYDSVSSKFHSK